MNTEDTHLMIQGYNRRMVDFERMLRRAVLTAVTPWLKSAPNPFQVYPIAFDEEIKKRVKTFSISPDNQKKLDEFKEKERQQKAKDN